MKLFVSNIPFATDESELEKIFSSYGKVSSVKIIIDRFTGHSRGFGFVDMESDEEAQGAIEELNGASLNGRPLVVKKSEPRPANNRRS